MNKKTCTKCNGRGQTKQSRTTFHFVKKNLPNGKTGQQMVTDKRGSGCLGCLGVGYLDGEKKDGTTTHFIEIQDD